MLRQLMMKECVVPLSSASPVEAAKTDIQAFWIILETVSTKDPSKNYINPQFHQSIEYNPLDGLPGSLLVE